MRTLSKLHPQPVPRHRPTPLYSAHRQLQDAISVLAPLPPALSYPLDRPHDHSAFHAVGLGLVYKHDIDRELHAYRMHVSPPVDVQPVAR